MVASFVAWLLPEYQDLDLARRQIVPVSTGAVSCQQYASRSSMNSILTMKHLHRRVLSVISLLSFAFPSLAAVAANDQVSNKPGASAMHEVVLGNDQFLVSDGYELSKAAAPSLVTRPTVADWDSQGRLVVIESAGAVGSTQEQLEDKPHTLIRLEDEDGDGVFDHREVIAENLSFYSGVLCVGNDIYVSAPPSILKLTDQDGDGFYEQPTVWHDGGTLTYCANDLHGPYAGPDGWIYWCKGAFEEQTHHLIDGTQLVSSAAHILRKRPEGGPVDIVSSGGMDNPIELAFLANGERFFTSTFLQHPSGGRRDGIGHAVRGSVFGKQHQVIDGLPRTGGLMPIMTHLGPAAPSGLTRLRFGNDDDDVLVCAQFNLHRVSMHTLVSDGATYQSLDKDLVSSDRLDFHPTDVIEDRDGSIVFLDTGDWYDLCCPSSGVEGKRSTGGVYRLRKASSANPTIVASDEKDGNASVVLKSLNDPRFDVRDQALSWILQHPQEGIAAIRKAMENVSAKPHIAIRYVNALSKMETPESSVLLNGFLADGFSPAVHHAALNALTLGNNVDIELVHSLLVESDDPAVKRAAAECMGMHAAEASVDVLMGAVDEQTLSDRVLQHSMYYALIQLNQPDRVAKYLNASHAVAQQHAALLVMQQIAPTQLQGDDLFRLFDTPDDALRTLAANVMRGNKSWAASLLEPLTARTLELESDSAARRNAESVLAAWIEEPVPMKRWKQKLSDPATGSNWLALLTAIPVSKIPNDWDEAIASRIASRIAASTGDAPLAVADWLARSGINAANHPLTTRALIQLAGGHVDNPKQQLRIAAAIPAGINPDLHGLSQTLAESLLQTNDTELRDLAVAATQRLTLDRSVAQDMLSRLNEASTLTLPSLVEAIAGSDASTAELLLEQLATMPLARTLPPTFLPSAYSKYPELEPRAKEIAVQLSQGPPEMVKKLQALLSAMPKGDMVRGMRVFHGTKAACGACHQMGYVGGDIGPELTRIGKSRSRLALLEAIVFPSSHIAQGYRSVQVLTVDGRISSGLIRHETTEELHLATGTGPMISIHKDEIEERHESAVSIMPNGLDGSMTQQELADVLELLSIYTSQK